MSDDNTPTQQDRVEPTVAGTDRRGSIIWAIIAFLILIFVDAPLKFGGIDVRELARQSTTEVWTQGVISVAFAIFLIIWIVRQLDMSNPSDRKEGLWGTAFITLLLVSFNVGAAHVGIVVHVIFALLICYMFLYPLDENKARVYGFMFIAVLIDLYLFPLINWLWPAHPGWINPFIIPVWLIITLFKAKPSGWRTFLIIIFICAYFFYSAAYEDLPKVGVDTLSNQEIDEAKAFFSQSWNNFYTFATTAPYKMVNSIVRTATEEEYYVGEIDEEAEQRLGVYFDSVLASQTAPYKQGEPIVVSAELWAQTLKDNISIDFKCMSENRPGSVEPGSLDITDFDQTYIDCSFPFGLEQGSHEITLLADFNFETSAYLKSYFIDTEDRRQGEDKTAQLVRYGVIDRNPVAVYTTGPVNIGMESGVPPTPIRRDGENPSIPLRFTFTNQWEGTITSVNSLVIQLPKEFALVSADNNPDLYCGGISFEEISCSVFGETGCQDSSHRVYQMSDTAQNFIGNIDQFERETISCRIAVVDPNDVFNDRSISFATKHFRILVGYDYQLEGTSGVTVERGENVKSTLGDCDDICRDSDGCLCPSGCEIPENWVVTEGNDCGVIGLEKGKVGVPVPECTTISSCEGDSYIISCDDITVQQVNAIADQGIVTYADDSSIVVTYGDIAAVRYEGLTHVSKQLNARPNKDEDVGSMQESMRFSIEENGNPVDLVDYYSATQFTFENENCVQSLNSCDALCEDEKGCSCSDTCNTNGLIKFGQNCNGVKNG